MWNMTCVLGQQVSLLVEKTVVHIGRAKHLLPFFEWARQQGHINGLHSQQKIWSASETCVEAYGQLPVKLHNLISSRGKTEN